jgi:hypothetical protein
MIALRAPPVGSALPPQHAALLPETDGLLLLVAAAYHAVGGRTPLCVGDTTLTVGELSGLAPLLPSNGAALRPPDPAAEALPGGGPPADFSFHTTGLAVDILKPKNPQECRLLDYVLGCCEDRMVLWRTERRNGPDPYYHLVPNPRFGEALARIASTGHPPVIAGV